MITGSDHGPRVAVVGGGISGLAAAWFLRQSLGPHAEIIVLEKKDVLGGHLRVSEVAGLAVDEGAESLLARRPEAVDLATAVGLGDDIVHPASVGAAMWSRGSMAPIPSGTLMGVPADPSGLADLLTPAEIATATQRDQAPGLPIDDDVSIGKLVESRMGRAVVDRLVDPLLGGVYAGRADELSLDATIPALGEALRKESSLAAGVRSVVRPPTGRPVFAGIDGGVGRLPSAVGAASGAALRTGVTVRELSRTGTGWQLVTGPVPSPSALHVDAIVLAVPPTPAARLLDGVAAGAAAELAQFETSSMAIVTLAVPASAFPTSLSSSGFLVPPVEGLTVKAATYSSVKWPWLGERAGDLVIVRASIGRSGEARVLQRDDDDLVKVTMADLGQMVGLRGEPVDTRVTRWGGALPQYAVGHPARVARIRAAVEQVPGLSVCGAVYDGVGVAACIASGRDAAAKITFYIQHPQGAGATGPHA